MRDDGYFQEIFYWQHSAIAFDQAVFCQTSLASGALLHWQQRRLLLALVADYLAASISELLAV
jgi:hypothetical protein